MELEDWLAYLERIHPREMDLGLDRVRQVHERLGSPIPAQRIVTVAGTNGKGSTVAALDALLRAHGLRTGTTTSPHLDRFNERICIDGVPATDRAIVAAFERIEAARAEISLTYFEFAILAAFDLLSRERLDVAVLEVGLGGRLDAVNVLAADVAVITSVALDHEAWLGTDRDSIGREKAGILRRGRPLVCGEGEPPASVLALAAELAVPVYRAGREFTLDAHPGGWSFRGGVDDAVALDGLPAPVLHPANLACALQVATLLGVELGADRVHHAFAGLTLPGRMQHASRDGVELILDVAHNPHAVAGLMYRLEARQRYVAVLGTYRDKRVEIMTELLADRVEHLYLAPTPGTRGQSAAELAGRLDGAAGCPPHSVLESIEAALQAAVTAARESGAVVLVLGSFTVVTAAARWLATPNPAGRQVS